ncbi:MAG TPA: NAD(P)H-hydrate dehydratase [Gemmatimonadales bacterium]|jgi:NAD(P)H-hydrate epimerase|nr:NAD(P)H-hydrate dehydratase [Gemmatimonadales bacterium]
MPTLPVLTPVQAAEWDRRAERCGIPARALMECAGRAAAGVLAARYADRLRQGVLVACGPGNNGGDGWVVARALHAAGAPVWVAPSGDGAGELARAMAGLAREAGVRIVQPDGPWPAVGLAVDALLGTGATGAPRGEVAALLGRVADLERPVIAVDGPSGLDLASGVQHGPLRAALSITFGGYRRGHLLARDETGDLVVVDLGFPEPDPGWPVFQTEAAAAGELAPFPASAHKGDRGRVVVVGGDNGMLGAARLTVRSVFAAGAGLVHLVAPTASVTVIATAEPDLQTCVQPFEAHPNARTTALLARADAVVIGPGLGRSPSRADFVLGVIESARSFTPIVLDADGLMAFAGQTERLREALREGEEGEKSGRTRVILTPHAGEFRALFPEEASRLVVDPWGAAEVAAARVGATVLLKGVPTVVALREGDEPTLTVAAGNPGLATGGSGDMLSGLIATLLAQGLRPARAGGVAAQALGEAADLAARRVTARAMRPMDVLAALSDVWRRWDLLRREPPPPRPPILHELPAPQRI